MNISEKERRDKLVFESALGRYRELEELLINKWGQLFPNYVWFDAETSIDLMAAEILALRRELENAKVK